MHYSLPFSFLLYVSLSFPSSTSMHYSFLLPPLSVSMLSLSFPSSNFQCITIFLFSRFFCLYVSLSFPSSTSMHYSLPLSSLSVPIYRSLFLLHFYTLLSPSPRFLSLCIALFPLFYFHALLSSLLPAFCSMYALLSPLLLPCITIFPSPRFLSLYIALFPLFYFHALHLPFFPAFLSLCIALFPSSTSQALLSPFSRFLCLYVSLSFPCFTSIHSLSFPLSPHSVPIYRSLSLSTSMHYYLHHLSPLSASMYRSLFSLFYFACILLFPLFSFWPLLLSSSTSIHYSLPFSPLSSSKEGAQTLRAASLPDGNQSERTRDNIVLILTGSGRVGGPGSRWHDSHPLARDRPGPPPPPTCPGVRPDRSSSAACHKKATHFAGRLSPPPSLFTSDVTLSPPHPLPVGSVSLGRASKLSRDEATNPSKPRHF
ncbi:hypothetical protein C7M84_006143 [Penaeus vannamei]|uniref:Uncharacterized protein n=1 Tax=Penaeus vannamei TaxID=6689 RepID=A0A423TG33_PENVA|nr:hypothetical protein C7M84_006143 [Penaeus vannamei]